MKLFACLIFAFSSGALTVLGWAPFEYWPLAVAGFAGLYWLISNGRTALQSAWIGFAFGVGLHAVGQDWIFSSLHSKAGLPSIPASLITIFFVIYLALFSALPCMLWHAIFKHHADNDKILASKLPGEISAVLGFAALLSLGEWARSLLFLNGFTSLSFGYSLIDTWLAGYAPVAGLYGLSAIGFCISGLLANLSPINRTSKAPFLVLICVIAGAGLAVNQVPWVQTSGIPLSYRLIQPNIVQNHKFNSAYVNRQVQQLVEIIEQKSASIIVTPETAFAIRLSELPAQFMQSLQQFSKQTGSHVFLGIISLSTNSDGYNSLVQITPDQADIPQYNKVWLMPFGEYSPSGFRWLSDSLNIPFKDMSAGSIDQAPFTVGPQHIGTLICHEDGSGQELRHWLPGASILLNPSNLAWFDDSFFIDQNLQMVRMRALESGRPILRTTNTGITAHIDHHGNVIRSLAKQEQGVLVGMVQPIHGMTPYSRWGNWLSVLGNTVYLAFTTVLIYRKYRQRVGE